MKNLRILFVDGASAAEAVSAFASVSIEPISLESIRVFLTIGSYDVTFYFGIGIYLRVGLAHKQQTQEKYYENPISLGGCGFYPWS